MISVSKDKIRVSRFIRDYFFIIIGSFILAIGFVFFITPYKIVPGGFFGIAIIVHYMTAGLISFWPEGIPVGITGLVLNIPLTFIGIKILGPKFGLKTVVGFVLSSVFMDGITMMREIGDAPLVDDVLLSCVFGGVLIGFGTALIFKARATSGGSDIIAMIIAKYTNWPLGQLLIYVDSAIVLFGLVAFQDWKIPLYSLLVIYITGKAVDATMEVSGYNKALFIISKEHEKIKKKIIVDIERGGTYLKGKGMFTDEEKDVIWTVVSRREVAILEEYIHSIDPCAFIAVMDTREILGEGFQSLKHKIEP